MTDQHTILIVGVGALGRRHLEACLKLPQSRYRVVAVEPSDAYWTLAEASIAATGRKVHRSREINTLPDEHYGVAIIATRSDVRAKVLGELLGKVSLGGIILEKVLFQKLEEYAVAAEQLAIKKVPAWVNCPRRMWPGYSALKEKYGEQIASCTRSGQGWDIGCNGIHYLDLFDFLCDAESVSVAQFDMPDAPKPAKRTGMQHVFGRCEGTLATPSGGVPFVIEARKADCPDTISFELRNGGRLSIAEQEPEMIVTHTMPTGESTSEVFPTLFQSNLSNLAVENIVECGEPGLIAYSKSRMLHEAFLTRMHESLLAYLPDLPQGYCPVT